MLPYQDLRQAQRTIENYACMVQKKQTKVIDGFSVLGFGTILIVSYLSPVIVTKVQPFEIAVAVSASTWCALL